MFDNALVIWNSDMANGGHGMNSGLMIAAGKLGGAVKLGRRAMMGGAAHTSVLAAIGVAMGAPAEAFGTPSNALGT